MKIIHYSLGFPPERTGGLVQYVLQLAKEQKKLGHDVSIMYPGRINIAKRQTYMQYATREEIKTIEIVNSLPLPLIGNIGDPRKYMTPIKSESLKDFLLQERPDVIHVHTLMGLFSEFLTVAREQNIKLVFTTHDYFGISPNPKFFLNGYDFAEDTENDIWEHVADFGTSVIKHRLLQTSMYPYLRRIAKFAKTTTIKVQASNNKQFQKKNPEKIDKIFLKLKKYYSDMFLKFDVIHFNSNVAKNIYSNHLQLGSVRCETLYISSENICYDKSLKFTKNVIKKIAFIGPYTVAKGFDQFLEFAEKNYKLFDFVAMGDNRKISNKYHVKNLGKFTRYELNYFLKDIDLVIVPSSWHETFGLVGLEATSRNVKTIVSTKVGFSDLLSDDFTFNELSEINLKQIGLSTLNIEKIDNMSDHTAKIIDLYL